MATTSRHILACTLALAAVVLLGTGCGGPQTPTASEGKTGSDQAAVVTAHKQLLAALSAADADGFAGLLDPSPDLLIFHPLLADRFDGVEMVRRNLPAMFTKLGKATWTEVHPLVVFRDGVAWITYYVLVEAANLPRPFAGRGTEIWNRTEEGWRLVHAHWSQTPTYPEGTS
jgi:hypothetical protein